ncbi:MAG: hypothetical protein ACWGPN_04675, partial [Gammaproteobacteria bacterium]
NNYLSVSVAMGFGADIRSHTGRKKNKSCRSHYSVPFSHLGSLARTCGPRFGILTAPYGRMFII